jgi:saccharopine dehydrogenase-like NADP-dependent oxidoreductase
MAGLIFLYLNPMNMGKHIFLFGAGKSATELIIFLIRACEKRQWHLTVVDAQETVAFSKTLGHPLTTALSMDILADEQGRQALVRQADIVISMLPPTLHQLIAIDCLEAGKHLLTASYVDDGLRAMAPAIRQKQLLFLCEMGMDPGLDHMSALKAIRAIRAKGGQITSFRSHCGGLVAPESDDNPWRYKITWNPRNVVLAGRHGARYREDGVDKQVSYESLFNPTLQVAVPGLGPLAYYPNRDSLGYATLYGLDQIPTFIRTTLRYPAFVSGWKSLIALDLTDETPAYDTTGMTLASFFLAHCKRYGVEGWLDNSQRLGEQLKQLLKISAGEADLLEKQLLHLGWNSGDKVKIRKTPDDLLRLASAADILQFALETKLALRPEDKDMVVMLHEIRYTMGAGAAGQTAAQTTGQPAGQATTHTLNSSLLVKGKDAVHTAMARTVGLPLGIAAVLIMEGKIALTGLHIPTTPEIYLPVLEQLEQEGIVFVEKEV